MGTRKKNIIIIATSVIISAAIWIITLNRFAPQHFQSKIFKVTNGWGFDILVDDSTFIHQESIPVIQTQEPFAKRDEAEEAAQLIIEKLKKGQYPTLTRPDLDKILQPGEK